MARAPAGNALSGVSTGVRIVVVGDPGTGKSSLIDTAATDVFPVNVRPMLPPTHLPEDFCPDHVPLTIIDTSSRVADSGKLGEELRWADAVVLTYACDQPAMIERLSTFWLLELRRLEVKIPVIVVGCKLDLIAEHLHVSLGDVMTSIKHQFWEIKTSIECSANRQIQIPEVFYYAREAVLHPIGALFDPETQTLKPRCVRALKWIFIFYDRDRDSALSDAELNNFLVKCFNAPQQPSEIVEIKRVVQEKLPGGVNEYGLTLTGFLFLHALFIITGHVETTWTTLRKFGYDNDIKLAKSVILSFPKGSPDQSMELTYVAIENLKRIFKSLDIDEDGALRPMEIEALFSTAPECPWNEAPYKDAAGKTALEGLSLDEFLSQWALMTLLDPSRTLENLIYIRYPGDLLSAFRVTKMGRYNRKKPQSNRNVFQCLVFGPRKAGKSALLNSFLGRPFSATYSSTTDERYAVNVVDQPGGVKKTLVLQEIPEDGVQKMLVNEESLAACDIAVFVHDSSDMSSWMRATKLLVEVANHGKITGFEVPCLIVAAKDDLDPFPTARQFSTQVSQVMRIEAPIPISAKLGDFSFIFRSIVNAAEHPGSSIPETRAGRSHKQYHGLVDPSLMFLLETQRLLAASSSCILPAVTQNEGGTKPEDKGFVSILSIDGGGIRGVMAAVILSRLESELQQLDGQNARIADYFYTIAGTSTGGLITVMLTCPNEERRPLFTAKEILDFYMRESGNIFPQPRIRNRWLPDPIKFIRCIRGPKYDGQYLHGLLRNVLGQKRLRDTLTNIVIVTYDTKTLAGVVFSSHELTNSDRQDVLLSDICISTSAAPVYLPSHTFSTPSEKFHLIDGGICANNPLLSAVVEVQKIVRGGNIGLAEAEKHNEFLILSIGTGTNHREGYETHGWGLFDWFYRAGDCPLLTFFNKASMDTNSMSICWVKEALHLQESYLRIQEEALRGDMCSLDIATEKNLQDLLKAGQDLLKKPVSLGNGVSGGLSGLTNEQALKRFARVLVARKNQKPHVTSGRI